MADSGKKPAEAPPQPPPAAHATNMQSPTAEDDSDPDFDDLDDVLDQFSANAPSQPKPSAAQPLSQSTPTASGPGRPSSSSTEAIASTQEPLLPTGQKSDESESEFIERLSKEMSAMLGSFAADPAQNPTSPEDMARMGKELEEFTYKMEKEGIQPEDLLKALLGEEEGSKLADAAREERDRLEKAPSSSSQPSASKSIPPESSSPSTSSKPQPKSFEDTIRNTMSRLGESDKSATTAAQKSSTKKSEEDLLADMLRALDSGPSSSGDGNNSDISNMFLEMMQQLTHKDLLYEPMKELHTEYPAWLAANKSKLPKEEYERYERQSVIVSDITNKFEEPGFSDDDPKCKEFIWEKMQRMQDEGAPPEELVKNPFPGTEFGNFPGLGGAGGGDAQLPEGLGKELEEGCPTQ